MVAELVLFAPVSNSKPFTANSCATAGSWAIADLMASVVLDVRFNVAPSGMMTIVTT